MKKTLFITGASGFIGRNLLKEIDFEEYSNIFCLGRNETDTIKQYSGKSNFRFIKGDISDSASYAEFVRSADIVLHLAALTGKASPEEYVKVNSDGTRILLEHAAKSNVNKFVFISTIAADFRDIEGYHYAHSKIDAENYVRESGLPYIIVRPTIVLGQGSPILNSLLQLAKAPLVPIFGNGLARIQPIFIDDLVQCILGVVRSNDLLNRTVTAAGPEQMSLEDFIRKLHSRVRGNRCRVIHLPVKPIKKVLLMMEKKYLSYLPFTAGQLATFTNDGTAERSLCTDPSSPVLRNVDEMLKLSLMDDKGAGRTSEDLKKECTQLARYLNGRDPNEYIQDKYVRAHEVTGIGRNAEPFDLFLIKAANINPFFLKLADAYSSILYKNAVIRNKLLLVLAVLECSDAAYLETHRVPDGARSALCVQLVQRTFCSFLTLIAAVLVFSPFKMFMSRTKNEKKPDQL